MGFYGCNPDNPEMGRGGNLHPFVRGIIETRFQFDRCDESFLRLHAKVFPGNNDHEKRLKGGKTIKKLKPEQKKKKIDFKVTGLCSTYLQLSAFKLWDGALILPPGPSLYLPEVHFPQRSSPLSKYSPSAPDAPPPPLPFTSTGVEKSLRQRWPAAKKLYFHLTPCISSYFSLLFFKKTFITLAF